MSPKKTAYQLPENAVKAFIDGADTGTIPAPAAPDTNGAAMTPLAAPLSTGSAYDARPTTEREAIHQFTLKIPLSLDRLIERAWLVTTPDRYTSRQKLIQGLLRIALDAYLKDHEATRTGPQ